MEVVSFESSGLEVVHPQHQPASASPTQGSVQSPISQLEPSEGVTDQYKGHYAFAQQEPMPIWQYVDHNTEAQTMSQPLQPLKRKWNWWWPVVAGVAAVLIVGAAVGGGVGSKLSTCEADLRHYQAVASASSSSQSITQTTADSISTTSSASSLETSQTTNGGMVTDYIAELPTNVYSLGDNCTQLAATTQTTTSSGKSKFSVYCKVDFGNGARTGGDGSNITLSNIICLTAYSMEDCLNACDDYSYRSSYRGRDDYCGSVTYSIFMSQLAPNNCCLKNSTVTHKPNLTNCDGCISAILID